MNQLLLKHSGSNLFNVPDGLKELMSDITREVIRAQPEKIFEFVSNYLSVLLITRENGMISVKLLEDLCDCKPMVADHLVEIGVTRNQAQIIAELIKDEVEMEEPIPGQEKLQELFIMKRVLEKFNFSESLSEKIYQITQNAYREYWYRKQTLEKSIVIEPDHPWKIAMQNTLDVYRSTRPSASELVRAEQKVEAAYKSYYSCRKMLKHLLQKPAKVNQEKIDTESKKLDVVVHTIDNKVDANLGSMMCIKSKDTLAEEKQKTSNFTHILNDEEDDAPQKTQIGKKPKKSFKFSSDSKENVSSYFTEVKVTPKIGTAVRSVETSTLPQRSPIEDVAKDVLGGLDDAMEDIPEIINITDDLSDIDEYDIPEAVSDNASGTSSYLTMNATGGPMSSDTEEVEDTK